jgi:hypothetical protein
MLRRRVSAVFLVVLTVAGIGVTHHSFGADGRSSRLGAQFSDSLPRNTTIRLATGAFDPLRGVPSVAADLRAARPRHWMVQAHYPATKATRDAVVAAGARIVAQLPDVTWIVTASPAVASQIRHQPGIRWVGPYQPAYKLSPLLTDVGRNPARLRVWPHRDVDGATLARQLAPLNASGVSIVEVGHQLVTVDAPNTALHALARVENVAWIEHLPTYQLHNANALWTTDTGERDVLGAAAPGRLDGAGQTAAVADTGVNYVPDPNGRAQRAFSDCDAAGRCKLADYVQGQIGNAPSQLETVTKTGAHHRKMAGYFNLTADPIARSQEASWHGTHTAGSVAADYPDDNGKYGTRNREADGMAPAARLIFQDVESGGGLGGLPGDPYDLFNQVYDLNKNGKYDPLEDARTHNNSYGAIYPEFDDGGAARTDDFIVEHPDMTIVFSAANSGPNAATLAGGPQESKNVITSCASANGNQPLASPDTVAVFSSHGPTIDGRVKPDVCTPGQIVVSPKGGTVDDDQYLQGTSMSGPVLVGLATLVRQYYWDGFGAVNGNGFASGMRDFSRRYDPSAALTKATIINSAQRMRGRYTGDDGRQLDGQWPSSGQGWGKVQLDSALYFPGDDRALFTVDRPSDAARGLETGTSVTETLDVAPGQPLDISLVWSDPSSALPAGTPVLVNNLDLTVTAPDGTVFRGNNFTTQSATLGQPGDNTADVNESRPGPGAGDTKNNVEGVRIANPAAGQWKITVAGTNVLSGPQGYALVASGRIATDTPRIVTDAPKYQPGKQATGFLLGTHLNGDIAGFERLAPGVYRIRQTAAGAAVSLIGGGAVINVPVDSAAPLARDVNVESVAADLARITWTTDEKSTGEVVVRASDGTATTYPDVYNVSGFKGLSTPQVETTGVYLNRKVLSFKHTVNATGLAAGTAYTFAIKATDEAGNTGDAATGSFTSTDAIFSPNATDQAALVSGEGTAGLPTTDLPVADPVGLPVQTGQPWGLSTQFYTGKLGTTASGTPVVAAGAPVESMPAFMFRMPATLDPNRITAAAVELFSAHDIVDPYNDRPEFSMDLVNSSVEAAWGPGQTYTAVRNAPADVHMASDPTLRRGANVPYVFHVPCNDIDAFRKNLAADAGGRRAAFRLRGITNEPESLFSFETGYGRRSRGPQLRPRLILFLDGNDPMPCTATAAPKISDVLVDHNDDTSAVVSWRTDVPADSTVYVRKAGTTDWTPVSAPVRVTQHFVRVGNLDKGAQYEFVVRSATCNGLVTVDDNHGSAYALFRPQAISGVFAQDGGGNTAVIGWSTTQPGTSVVKWGAAPGTLDKTATTAGSTNNHTVTLALTECQRIYFRVETTGADNKTVSSGVYSFDKPAGTGAAVASFDFESGPQGFTVTPAAGNGNASAGPIGVALLPSPTIWERRSNQETGGSQAFRTVIKSPDAPGYTSNVDIRLVSPPIAVPEGIAALTWREVYNLEPNTAGFEAKDAPLVELSVDDGRTWTVERQTAGGQNANYPLATPMRIAIPDEFTGHTIRVGFHFTSDDNTEVPDGGWAVDDVRVVTPRCPVLLATPPAAPPAPTNGGNASASGLGPLPAPSAGASSIGVLPTPDTPSDVAKRNGTCKCGPIHFLPASGGGIVSVTPPVTPPKVLGARGRLPATGGGLLALPALCLLGGARGLHRLKRRRRRR